MSVFFSQGGHLSDLLGESFVSAGPPPIVGALLSALIPAAHAHTMS